MNKFINELNKIARKELDTELRYECKFCGLIRKDSHAMVKHIIKHLKEVLPVCKECGQQHVPDPWHDSEDILNNHTMQFYYGLR